MSYIGRHKGFLVIFIRPSEPLEGPKQPSLLVKYCNKNVPEANVLWEFSQTARKQQLYLLKIIYGNWPLLLFTVRDWHTWARSNPKGGVRLGEGREGLQQIKFQLWLGKTFREELRNSHKIQIILRWLIRIRRCVDFWGRTPWPLKGYPAPPQGVWGGRQPPGW